MKRDVVFDVVRDLCQFDCDLHVLANAFIPYKLPDSDPESVESSKKQRSVELGRFYSSNAKIRSSKFIAEMLVGKKLITALSTYYEAIWSAGIEIWHGNEQPYVHLHSTRELMANTVYDAARKELKIKNTDHVVVKN